MCVEADFRGTSKRAKQDRSGLSPDVFGGLQEVNGICKDVMRGYSGREEEYETDLIRHQRYFGALNMLGNRFQLSNKRSPSHKRKDSFGESSA